MESLLEVVEVEFELKMRGSAINKLTVIRYSVAVLTESIPSFDFREKGEKNIEKIVFSTNLHISSLFCSSSFVFDIIANECLYFPITNFVSFTSFRDDIIM